MSKYLRILFVVVGLYLSFWVSPPLVSAPSDVSVAKGLIIFVIGVVITYFNGRALWLSTQLKDHKGKYKPKRYYRD